MCVEIFERNVQREFVRYHIMHRPVFVPPFWHLLVDLKYLGKGRRVTMESIINETHSSTEMTRDEKIGECWK